MISVNGYAQTKNGFAVCLTEEKAKAMVEVSTRDSKITKRYYEYLLKEITEWLKQPHGGE